MQPAGPGQPPHPVLKRCAQVLDPMARAVPGLLEALYLLGKVKFLSGMFENKMCLFYILEQNFQGRLFFSLRNIFENLN